MFLLTLLAVLTCLYTYVGYPVLIAGLARLWPRPWKADERWQPSVSVLIPVHNAEGHILGKLESLRSQTYPASKLEIILASDGSTDGSMDLAREFQGALPGEGPALKLLEMPARSGKPAALNHMRRHARGEVLVLTDIRQCLSPNAIAELVGNLADPQIACVAGSLELRGGTGAGFYWRYENRLRIWEGRFRSMLGVTGPLYAIRSADLVDLPTDMILDDMWVPMRLRLQGRRIVLAEKAQAFDDAFADEREFGRKARTLAGNYQLFACMPALLSPFHNPSWFETVSHKILRLVCPWMLAVLALATIGMLAQSAGMGMSPPAPAPAWRRAYELTLAGAQLGFYGLALLGAVAGKPGTIARTFVVMNWAAIVGLWRFARSTQKITW